MEGIMEQNQPRGRSIFEELMFSIIIPAYNIQNFIKPCLDSIADQSMQEYEVIIIDDGSTDGTGVICDDYVAEHDNFFVYHVVNKGLSAARNLGVKNARGKYLVFVDGDDYLKTEAFSNFKNAILTYGYPDVLLEEGEYFDKDGILELSKRFEGEKFGVRTGAEALKYLLSGKSMWAAFGKCFKKSFWDINHFKFQEGITSEDFELIYKVIYKAASVAMTSNSTYCYRYQRKGSIIEGFNAKNIQDLFSIMEGWEVFFLENHVEKDIVNGMYTEFGNLLRCFVLFRIADADFETRKKLKPLIKKKLKYLLYCKNHMLYFIGRICGIECLLSCCKLYLNVKSK